jgi:hypothetical protein
MFRISRTGSDEVVDVDSTDQIEPAIQAANPGRYHVDEIVA